MAKVEFQNVTKIFGEVHAVDDLSLTVEDGEFIVVVGPSGCGKSTLLRLVAGLEELTEGDIYIGDNLVNHKTPQERNVAMVFQNYALYPHKSVRKNLEFPLRMMGIEKDERHKRIEDAARKLGITSFLDRKPTMLSGGQQQRVSMGRAIVRDPRAFLMDEPLSNLDAKLRVEIRTEIADLQRDLGITTIYVTHDQVEAMTLGDRIAVLLEGKLQQVDTAKQLYNRPVNTFVASFIGGPSMNIFKSRLHSEGEQFTFNFGDRQVPIDAKVFDERRGAKQFADQELLLGLRPEAFVQKEEADEKRRFKGRVHTTEELGHERIVYFESPVEKLTGLAESPREQAGNGDDEEERPEASTMIARLPATGEELEKGDEVELGIDTSELHFFTTDGEAIYEE